MNRLKVYLKPFLNLKFIFSFGVAWLITNGWAYICLGLGVLLRIGWLQIASSAYIAFLYLPFTIEKIITIPLSIFLQEKLFPKDLKLHHELVLMHIQVKKDYRSVFKKSITRKELKKLME